MHEDILDFNEDGGVQSSSYEYAGFWIRVGASIIDTLVFIPLAFLNVYNVIDIKSLPLQLLILVLYIAYKPFMEYQYGATLGKMAVKIKVIDTAGNPIEFEQALIRSIPYLLITAVSMLITLSMFFDSGFGSLDTMVEYSEQTQTPKYAMMNGGANLLYLISCIFVAFRPNRQALHDSMASTYCIRQ